MHGLNIYFLAKFCCSFLNIKNVKEADPIHVNSDHIEVKMSDDNFDIGFTTKPLLKKSVDGGCDMYV